MNKIDFFLLHLSINVFILSSGNKGSLSLNAVVACARDRNIFFWNWRNYWTYRYVKKNSINNVLVLLQRLLQEKLWEKCKRGTKCNLLLWNYCVQLCSSFFFFFTAIALFNQLFFYFESYKFQKISLNLIALHSYFNV